LRAEWEAIGHIWLETHKEHQVVHPDGENCYFRETSEGVRYFERTAKASKQLASFWPWFLAVFKQRCRDFCESRDPQFRAMLQDILRNEDFTLPPFESCMKGSVQPTESLLPGFAAQGIDTVFWIKTDWTRNTRANTCKSLMWQGEDWIREFLTGMEDIYRKIDGGDPEGVFTRILSQEKKAVIQGQIYHILTRSYYFHLETLRKNPLFWMRYADESKFNLPYNSRRTHHWIIGSSGAGKTQLLQRMICDDIEHGRSVVVIDSQRDMINELLRWKHSMEVVLIDPEDLEYPPGIALFAMEFADEGQKTRIIEFYEYMFSVFGAELSSRQGSLFSFALRLMFTIPNANIHTLIDLFRNGDKYRPAMAKLQDSTEHDYFQHDFFDKQYYANKKQILDRLRKIVERPVLERVFAGTENKIDFFQLLNKPVAMFINTSKYHCGKVGCKLFGRFLISLIYDAILQRATMPREDRRQVYIYVDEGKDYGDEKAFEDIVYECRKYAGGLIFCSQNIGQLHSDTVSALMTSSIKMVRRLDEDTETRKMARTIRVDENELYDLAYKDQEYAEWMCYVANEGTTKIRCDFGYLENQPKISEAEYQHLREENRRKYCVSVGRGKPDGTTPRSTPKDPPDPPQHTDTRQTQGSRAKPHAPGGDVPKKELPQGPLPYDDDYF
jgi:hypothetical protein